ncbi:hypothetical protein [Ligilactobacillus salivarius]|uniref:hypothetical protein n=1 Tax=Ligilactobacillus salivarius TaxID=1624 RepID=UPI00136AAA24|nr:hypothetical protein [Ligilactobacillus salivarius]
MEIYTLTDEKRQRILSKLKYKQIKILSDFTMYKVKSEMITKDFVIANDWKLADIREDAFWNLRSMDNNQGKNIPKLKCGCGKNLRYQYILRSSSGKELKLGVTHFAQHAGIPQNIARQIHSRLNKVMIFRDEILTKYSQGQRFPLEEYNVVSKKELLLEFGEDFNYKLKKFKDANLPLFHVDESRLMKKYFKAKEANITLYRIIDDENFDDKYLLFKETLNRYIDFSEFIDTKSDAKWLSKTLIGCHVVEQSIENIMLFSIGKTGKILREDYIKRTNTRLKNLLIDENFKQGFIRILDEIKDSMYEKDEIDILLRKEEILIDLNVLQVELYGKDAIQDSQDEQTKRTAKEIDRNINRIRKKYDEYTIVREEYLQLINSYRSKNPKLVSNLEKISDGQIILPATVEEEYPKMIGKYNNLPKLNKDENKIVRYFMLRHKINIPGEGIKQGYSLSASLDKFKRVKDDEVKKLLLEYLILRVKLTEKIIEFKQQNMRDMYFKAVKIISKYDVYSYKKDSNIELYDIDFLINNSSNNTNIKLDEDIKVLKPELESIIAKSKQKYLIRGILNELVKIYKKTETPTMDILNILDKIVARESTFYYGEIHNSSNLWKQEFINFLYKVNYYYVGNKLSNDFLKVDKTILNKNLEFLVFIDEVVKPGLETGILSKEERIKVHRKKLIKKVKLIYGKSKKSKSIYGENKRVNKDKLGKYFYGIRRNLSVIDTLSGYGNLQRSERTEKLLSKRLNISSKKVEMIRKILEKYPQRDSVDFKREIESLPIPKDMQERIIFFEANKKDIREIKDAFEIKNKLVIK